MSERWYVFSYREGDVTACVWLGPFDEPCPPYARNLSRFLRDEYHVFTATDVSRGQYETFVNGASSVVYIPHSLFTTSPEVVS